MATEVTPIGIAAWFGVDPSDAIWRATARSRRQPTLLLGI